jgi:hypothetical protein
VEDKPEVRKAGGVYYTPTYIVDYIVKNTVGKLLEGKKPGPRGSASNIRILDPACGSGSFLIGAYQYLLDWHRDRYIEDGPEKWAKGRNPALYQIIRGEWRLTTEERKRILINSIYGVDIDPQAVEVTKLSLLLKVLEGKSEETIKSAFRLFHERALPDLGNNIKSGNSLIAPDFYQGKQMSLLDTEEAQRVNVFDWQAEFPEIFEAGGFDAVIGNPPYIFTREQLSEEERQYFATRYQLSWEKHNTFMLFMERLLQLIGKNGKGGFIVPNSWLTIESAKLLREAYVPRLELIADLGYLVFRRVSMEPCIFTVTGHDLQNNVLTLRVNSEERLVETKPASYDRRKWSEPNYRIVFSDNSEVATIIDKILQNSIALGEVFDVRTGLQAYEEGRGTPPQSADDVKNHVFDREKRVDGNSIKYLQGRDVGRYELNWSDMWMQYGHWLSQPREIDIFKRPRVLLREITSDYPYCLNAMFVQGDYLNNKSCWAY